MNVFFQKLSIMLYQIQWINLGSQKHYLPILWYFRYFHAQKNLKGYLHIYVLFISKWERGIGREKINFPSSYEKLWSSNNTKQEFMTIIFLVISPAMVHRLRYLRDNRCLIQFYNEREWVIQALCQSYSKLLVRKNQLEILASLAWITVSYYNVASMEPFL